jgi:serine protease AprX
VFPLPAASDAPVAGVTDVPAGISSRGATGYERVKPDVIAPGTFILSAKATQLRPAPGRLWRDFPENPTYVFLRGTRMAAPLGTGAARPSASTYGSTRTSRPRRQHF